MLENEQFGTKRMFEHACAFYDCAEFCFKENTLIKYRMKSHAVSGIVNSAFSCEIFLKALLFYSGKPKKGHKLKSLWEDYKKVDIKTACLVENQIKEYYASENENIFNELIERSSNSFEQWRYIYEYEIADTDINFLLRFGCLLREVCCSKLFDKSWEEYRK